MILLQLRCVKCGELEVLAHGGAGDGLPKCCHTCGDPLPTVRGCHCAACEVRRAIGPGRLLGAPASMLYH